MIPPEILNYLRSLGVDTRAIWQVTIECATDANPRVTYRTHPDSDTPIQFEMTVKL